MKDARTRHEAPEHMRYDSMYSTGQMRHGARETQEHARHETCEA